MTMAMMVLMPCHSPWYVTIPLASTSPLYAPSVIVVVMIIMVMMMTMMMMVLMPCHSPSCHVTIPLASACPPRTASTCGNSTNCDGTDNDDDENVNDDSDDDHADDNDDAPGPPLVTSLPAV